ncbi:hypothetical protein FG484_01295 [Burkholderia pseudomallei]|nr:hypothetical protein [Burkholderia pseudomallei]
MRAAFQREGNSSNDRASTVDQAAISNFISKKIGILEIDLEIVEALPDKAGKRKDVLISNSPEFFLRRQGMVEHGSSSTYQAYALSPVGIFVGIYEHPLPEYFLQPRDMNSVGTPLRGAYSARAVISERRPA